jgi:ubiquinone/menaquinone biosynthesis C-methylase UbiE
LLALLRQLRHATQLELNTDSAWPWQHTASALAPLLGAPPDLTAQAADDPLYTTALAAVYDTHRALAEPMVTALKSFASAQLVGCDVVELGAGTGRITRHLAGQGPASYHAIEPSPAMAALLTGRQLPGVRVVAADALDLPFDDASIDVVLEHEVLQFTADPLLAAEEALRILRPGGQLVRILLHPIGANPLAAVEAAYRTTAFADGPRPLFYGKGTDQRITDHLADRGLPTQTGTLAVFTHRRTPRQALDALADRAWPYQHQLTNTEHERGMAAAHQAAAELADAVTVEYALRTLITTLDREAH